MRNKNNIRHSTVTYHQWLRSRDSYDPFAPDRIDKSPFDTLPLSPLLEDLFETLEGLYYSGQLKPRHKQVVRLLLSGLTSHTDIAKRLSIKRSTVTTLLRQIGKKIIKNVDKYAV